MKRFKLLTMLVLMVVMALSMVVPAFAAGDSWETKADIPIGVIHPASAQYNGKIYVMGGTKDTSSSSLINNVQMYDTLTNTWSSKANMPYVTQGARAVTVNGKIYVIGGQINTTRFSNYVQIYDPTTDTWSVKTNMPTGRELVGLIAINDKIYVIGGQINNGISRKVEVYDPTTDNWTTKTDMPGGTFDSGAAELNGIIYIIGGHTSSDASGSNKVFTYTPSTDTWSTKSNFPLTAFSGKAGTINGKIFVAGGAGPSAHYNKLFEYNSSSDAWIERKAMTETKEFATAVVVNGKLYVVSGYNSANYPNNSNVVLEYTALVSIPVAPLNLAATAGNAQVTLNWTTVDGATGYNVKRSTTAGGPYTTVASNVYGSPYTDTTVTNGTTYYYVVTALNTAGESGNSNEASATPQGTVTPPTGNRALLVITLVSGLEKEYDLSMTEVNSFTTWYAARAAGTGPGVYTINKSFNKASFLTRKDNIAFNKIELYEVNEYTPTP